MTSKLDSTELGPTERHRNRRFYVQVAISVVLAAALAMVAALSRRFGAPEALAVAANFLPLLPMVWVGIVVVRFIARSDEWERRIYLVAASIALLAVLAVTVVFNALYMVGIVLPLGGWWAVIFAGSFTMFVAIWVQSAKFDR